MVSKISLLTEKLIQDMPSPELALLRQLHIETPHILLDLETGAYWSPIVQYMVY